MLRSMKVWAAVIVAAIVAGVVATVIANTRPVTYEAEAIVSVPEVLSGDIYSSPDMANRAIANQVLVAESAPVIDAAASQVGLKSTEDVFAAEEEKGADAIVFSATMPTPEKAAEAAQAFAEAYLDHRLGGLRDSQAGDEASLDQAMAAAKTAIDRAEKTTGSTAIREIVAQQLATQIADQATNSSALDSISASSLVVQEASVPTSPSGLPSFVFGALAAITVVGAALVGMLIAANRSQAAGAPTSTLGRNGGRRATE